MPAAGHRRRARGAHPAAQEEPSAAAVAAAAAATTAAASVTAAAADSATGADSATTTVAAVDLDETGWLLDPDTAEPVPHPALPDHFAERLAPPPHATDLFVYVHGWQTTPESAVRAAGRLSGLMRERLAERPGLYPAVGETGFEPWMLVVRWPSASRPGPSGYRLVRERAHAMGSRDGTGYAAHVIGRLLGYLDTERGDPLSAPVLANRDGQYLHLIGHSFGCRLLCEAVVWAADASLGHTLGWDEATRDRTRPFTVDSMLLFQMAAPRDAFGSMFSSLTPSPDRPAAPLRGPVVATHSRYDRATGFWHRRAEGKNGVGHSGIDPASAPVAETRLLPPEQRYRQRALDHPYVNVDATDVFSRGGSLNPAGAHSTHICPESAHLLLSLADFSRP
jgi:hypothetical protein